MLATDVDDRCEAARHHADLPVTWGKIRVKLRPHPAGGSTDRAFTPARRIEEAVLWRPRASGPLEGTPNRLVQGEE